MDKKTKMKEKKASGIWKKVLGICLAVIMVIGMTMPAWAQIDAESKGSIKVTADESGWTASAYRVIDVNFDFDNQQPKEPAYVWNKNAAEWVRTNFKDYIEADGNGVTEAFITMDTDKDAVKVKEFAIRCRRRSRQIRFRWEQQEAFSRVKVRRKRRSEIFQWADIFC